MRERFYHYSRQPFTGPVHDVEQHTEGGNPFRHHKPLGLWLTNEGEDDWPTWCRNERWGIDTLSYKAEVVLAPDARILRITNEEQLLAFHYMNTSVHSRADWYAMNYPDWAPIAQEYDGICIMPYIYECRFSVGWYYSWDVASACIWRARAVERVIPISHELPLEMV